MIEILKPRSESPAVRDNFRVTLPLEKGFIHISTSEGRLRKSVQEIASEFEIPSDRASAVLEKMAFRLTESKLADKLGIIGWVRKDRKSGKRTLTLNATSIVRIIDKPNLLEQQRYNIGFKVEPDMPIEAKIQGMSQLLNIVWRHEVQHLTERMDKNLREANRKKPFRFEKVAKGAAFLIGSGGAALLSQELLPLEFDQKIALFLMGKNTALEGLILVVGAGIYHLRYSQSEKRSFDAQKLSTKSDLVNSPFTVTFEEN